MKGCKLTFIFLIKTSNLTHLMNIVRYLINTKIVAISFIKETRHTSITDGVKPQYPILSH